MNNELFNNYNLTNEEIEIIINQNKNKKGGKSLWQL